MDKPNISNAGNAIKKAYQLMYHRFGLSECPLILYGISNFKSSQS